MAKYFFLRAAFTVCVTLVTVPAIAGFSVDVYVDNIFFETVTDNIFPDINPVVGDIEYDFSLTDVGNRWVADGVLYAEGGYNGVPPVSTVVTDTLIEKIADVPINEGQIDFVHHYAASGLQVHNATIDGQFDNEIDHLVKGASLEYYASISGQSMGGYNTGLYDGPGPHVFLGALGPLALATTDEHHMTMRFYLDSLGDSIEMFNSAEIHTTPEPTSASLLLVAAGAALLWSRRRTTALDS